jgi:hypothetical protein
MTFLLAHSAVAQDKSIDNALDYTITAAKN